MVHYFSAYHKENNIAVPDLSFAELKSHRENHTGLVTLFTFNRKAWKVEPLLAIEKYGSYDKNNRKGMYYTITRKPNSAGLFLTCNDDTIQVQHTSGEVILQWTMDSVADKFSQKMKNVILVSAKVELREGREYFYYYRARLLKGNMDKQGLINAFISIEGAQLIQRILTHLGEDCRIPKLYPPRGPPETDNDFITF